MIQLLRKFSIRPKKPQGGFTKDKYPVLAFDQTDEEDPTIFLLVTDDAGELTWLNQGEVIVTDIEG